MTETIRAVHMGVDVERTLSWSEAELELIDPDEPEFGLTVPDAQARWLLEDAIQKLGWTNTNITEPGDGIERGFASDLMATNLDTGEVVEIMFKEGYNDDDTPGGNKAEFKKWEVK